MKTNSLFISIIYSCLFSFLLIGQFVESLGIPLFVATGFRLLFLIILIYSYIYLWKRNALFLPSGLLKFYVLLFFTYSAIIMMRGEWSLSTRDFLSRLADINGPMIYLLPLIIIPLPNERYLRQVMRLAFYFSLLVVPLWLLNIDNLVQSGKERSYLAEGIGMWMPFISAFLLPMWGIFTKRERIVNILIFCIYFLLMLINARRNVCLSCALFLIISFFTLARVFNKRKIVSRELIILACIIIGFAVAISTKPLLNGPFSFLKERAKEDTRSGVEALFFADLLSSPIQDWIFGRGMDGKYEQLVVDNDTGDVKENRAIIETGYLNLLLKGGCVYVLFVLSLLLIAVVSLLKNKSTINNYFACVLLVYIIDLYTTNPVCIYYPRSILFWMLLSVAFTNLRKP